MSSPDVFEPEIVDQLTGAGRRSPDNDSLRRALLARTTRAVRCRRRLRRAAFAGALVGCYFGGLATMYCWIAAAESVAEPLARQQSVLQQHTSPSNPCNPSRLCKTETTQKPAEPPAPLPGAKPPPVKRSRFEVLCSISDRYLYERRNVELALRYYTRALNSATPEELAISIEKDSWLLIALKQARLKEMENEDPNA